MKKILVSACLMGYPCRYDGVGKPCQKVIDLGKDNVLIPVCPEQLGGLPTPRIPSERQFDENGSPKAVSRLGIVTAGAILMKDGTDVTENYARGAGIALETALKNQVDMAILKAGSPSCGHGLIYDGSFSGKKVPGNGITAELLESAGIKVLSDEEL